MFIWFGIGNIQYGSQGRPTWMPGKIPAQITAKIVIASAKRLIAVLQYWRSRNKIALISVPAWAIPTQKTKFTIGKPQATGTMFPQTPMPVQNAQVMLIPKQPSIESEMPSAMNHALGGRGVSVTRQTLSVIWANLLSPFGAAWKTSTSLTAAMV
jgi:hypothetical protein